MAGKGCSVFRKEIREWQVTKQQRKDILEACDRKEVDILFATQLAREGLDMQHLVVGHMVMPKRGDSRESNSGSSVEQEIGRIMRRIGTIRIKKHTGSITLTTMLEYLRTNITAVGKYTAELG